MKREAIGETKDSAAGDHSARFLPNGMGRDPRTQNGTAPRRTVQPLPKQQPASLNLRSSEAAASGAQRKVSPQVLPGGERRMNRPQPSQPAPSRSGAVRQAENGAEALPARTPNPQRRSLNPASQNPPSPASPAQRMPVQRGGAAVAGTSSRSVPQKSPARLDQNSGGNPASHEQSVRRQMEKTRTSDFKVNDVLRRSAENRKKSGADDANGSDEGGNTVISIIKAIVYIVFVLIISVTLSIAIISVSNDVFAFVKSDEAVNVTIPANTTLDELSGILKNAGVIRYPSVFRFYALYKNDDMDFVAGEYTVTPMMNYSTLLREFKQKEVTGTVRITIPEGYTTDNIISLFVDKYGIGTREGFVDVIQNGEFDYWFIRELEEDGVNPNRIYRLDGYLFPDTYEFYLNSSEKTVINRLLHRFGQIFTREYRNQCEELGFSVDQMVTLASMIEKEAAAPSEFFNVSSVFHNRLKAPDVFPNMESDATVVYAIEHATGERKVDLFYDSPYNTYMHPGFPPGPIANPSASALLAAMTVPETDFYYFVSDGNMTYFSENKEEHERKIAEIAQNGTIRGMILPTASYAPAGGSNP